jgi:GT2 family glycosyltransferase
LKPEISIVIPSYQPGAPLFRLLDSLRGQSLNVPREILVVDSSPVALGRDVRERYPEVRFVHLDRRTLPGRARTLGAEMARGEIVFFIDSDCVADPDWLARLRDAIREGYGMAGGSVLNGTPDSRVGTAEYLLEFNETNPGMPRREVRAVPSCSLAVDRRIFEEVGGFPDFMKGEDTIFCERVVRSGRKLLFVPEAKITHLNRTGFGHYLKNQVALGEGSLETRRRIPRHGRFLLRFPMLVPLIPAFRTAVIAKRFLESDRRLFVRYLRHYPLILLGMLFFTWGFIRGPHRSGLSTEKKGRGGSPR